MGRLFILDTENTTDFSFIDNYNVVEEDSVIFFKSDNSKNISLCDLEKVYSSKASLGFINCKVGYPNAMDFYIIMYLTNYVTKYPNDNKTIYIISDDGAYKNVLSFLNILQQHNINFGFITSKNDVLYESYDSIIKDLNSTNSYLDFHNLCGIQSETPLPLSELHYVFVKKLGNVGTYVYNNVKTHYKQVIN